MSWQKTDWPSRVQTGENSYYPSWTGRDRWKDSIGDLFLVRSIKIGDVNRVVALESDVLVARKCGCPRGT